LCTLVASCTFKHYVHSVRDSGKVSPLKTLNTKLTYEWLTYWILKLVFKSCFFEKIVEYFKK